jgi:hypothetical protein
MKQTGITIEEWEARREEELRRRIASEERISVDVQEAPPVLFDRCDIPRVELAMQMAGRHGGVRSDELAAAGGFCVRIAKRVLSSLVRNGDLEYYNSVWYTDAGRCPAGGDPRVWRMLQSGRLVAKMHGCSEYKSTYKHRELAKASGGYARERVYVLAGAIDGSEW